MQQRFFFLLLVSSISSNSCRSGCASSKIDGDLPVRPSWPFWEVDASPNSPVFTRKQFLVYLTATAFCLRDNFWILTNCFSFFFYHLANQSIFGFQRKEAKKKKTVTWPFSFRSVYLFVLWNRRPTTLTYIFRNAWHRRSHQKKIRNFRLKIAKTTSLSNGPWRPFRILFNSLLNNNLCSLDCNRNRQSMGSRGVWGI